MNVKQEVSLFVVFIVGQVLLNLAKLQVSENIFFKQNRKSAILLLLLINREACIFVEGHTRKLPVKFH